MAVGRGFVHQLKGAHGCGQGIRHQLSRVRMAGSEGSPGQGLVASSRAAHCASRPTGSRRCTALFSSARFCIFILNRLFVVLLSLDS